MFELRDAGKSFGDVVAVAPVSLAIDPRRTTVLIGPSGCGKSTLLGLMNGLVAPDTGSVVFDGDPVTADSAVALRRRLGYVIQEGGLFPHLTAGRNVSLMARHLGWPRTRITDRLAELCDLTRLPATALERYPSQLSGGQRQRVGLMRALMLNPDALLLDEPLGALDPMIRYDLQEELREVFRNLGKTVVLVTHDLGEAAFFADRIVLMRDGAIEQQGGMADLLDRPASDFVHRFTRAQRSHLAAAERPS
ncbi:MAG: ATP-binding cassette domain-containing protein [Alphaproteobacteria bacterium]